MGLFAEASVAIDGSKFKAVNNRDKNRAPGKVRDCLQGKNMEALDILFADDLVSVEAVAMAGVQQEY